MMLSVFSNFTPKNFYVLLQIVGVVILIGELLYVSLQKPSEIQKHLIFILTALTISFIGYYIELIAPNIETGFVGICIGYAGKPFALFASLLLLFDYTNIKFPKWISCCILLFFVALTVVIFTNSINGGLYYKELTFNMDNIASPVTIKTHGPFWYVYMTAAFIIYGAYSGITVYEFIRCRNKQAKQMAVLLFFVVIFSLLGLIGYIAKLTYGYDSTLAGILLGTIVLLILLTKYHLFDSLYLAQRKTLDESINGYVVLDARMQITFFNTTSIKLIPELAMRGRKNYEKAVQKLMSFKMKQNIFVGDNVYSLTIDKALSNSKKVVGVTYIFSDITEHYNYGKQLKEDVNKATAKVVNIQRQALIAFADVVEARDGNTGEHIKGVANISRLIAEELMKTKKYMNVLDEELINIIEQCAPLHDIGKIFVSDTILLKPGKLTPKERKIMQTHTLKGKTVIDTALGSIEEPIYLRTAGEIALYHHEWFDGTGYPTKLKGRKIPLSARIVAVADVYDALRMKRAYKPAFSKIKTLSIIEEEKGTHFDPDIVDALMNIQDKLY